MWNNSLRKMDIFGIKFGFKIKNEETYKTAFGGTLTILTLTIIIIFGVFFGQDFYYRINPSVYIDSIVPEKYDPPITLAPENFTIAWRIESNEKLGLNFSNHIYPIMKRFRFKRNQNNEMEMLENQAVPTTKCTSENAKMPEFSKSFKLEEWFCFDWTSKDFAFGGFWDGDYVNGFSVALYLCAEGAEYNSRNSNCTLLEDYRKFNALHGGLMMSIMYPQFFFAAEDLRNPLRITFRNFYYYFNLKTIKVDRLFFNRVSLKDDQGWIFEDTKSNAILSFNRVQSDQDLNEIFDGSSSELYTSLFYMEKGSQVIRRSFMKIQDVSAKVGGLIKLIVTLFSLLNQVFSNFKFHVAVLDEIFEFPEEGLKKATRVSKTNNDLSIKSRKSDKDVSNELLFSIKPVTFLTNQQQFPIRQGLTAENQRIDNIIIENNPKTEKPNAFKVNNFMINNNDKSNPDLFNKSDLSSISKNISINKNKSERNNESKNNSNIKFGLCFGIKNYFSSPSSYSEKKKLRVFLNLNKFLNQRMDLIYYLRTLYTIDITNSLLFNPFQKKLLEYPFKPNIFSKEDLHYFGLDKKIDSGFLQGDITDYFVTRFRENCLDKYDRKIFKILPKALTINIDSRLEIVENSS